MSCCGGNGRNGDIRGRRVYYVLYTAEGTEVESYLIWLDAITARDELGNGAYVRPEKRWPT